VDELNNINQNLSTKGVYDYNLVQNALKGNQKAYAELLQRYRESVFFMMLKMCNNKDDAEDLTIEAFGKAFRRLGQYTPQFAFSTWLFKIASNNGIDFIRKKRIRALSLDTGFRNEDGDSMEIAVTDDQPDPIEALERKERLNLMRDVVTRLKPRYRTLIELRYFEEYSYEEIAEELDLPLGTVKAQLFRARDFLFQILKNTRERF